MSTISELKPSPIRVTIEGLSSPARIQAVVGGFLKQMGGGDEIRIILGTHDATELVTSNGFKRPRKPSGSKHDQEAVLNAFADAVGMKPSAICESIGMHRSNWSHWKAGRPVNRAALECLIEKTPTDEIRSMLIAFRRPEPEKK